MQARPMSSCGVFPVSVTFVNSVKTNCDASLVVSGSVDCRRRRRNVYDMKPQCYAKDNRTAKLHAVGKHEKKI